MAATKNRQTQPPPSADGPKPGAEPARRELAWIETLFDRRRREKDRATSYFWDGREVLIVRAGKVARLAPIGVIRGPYLDEAGS